MNKKPMGIVGRCACVVAIAAGLPAAAVPAAPAGEYVVVLECPGIAARQVAPDASGQFVFGDVPAGACRVHLAPPAAPREAASGLPTGKRMHKPITFRLSLDGDSARAARTTPVDGSNTAVTVVLQHKQRELRGHVTLIK